MAVGLNSLENQEILSDGLWCWDLKNPGNGSISSKLAQQLGYFTKSPEPMSVDFLSLVFKEDLKIKPFGRLFHLVQSKREYGV